MIDDKEACVCIVCTQQINPEDDFIQDELGACSHQSCMDKIIEEIESSFLDNGVPVIRDWFGE